MVKGKLDGDDLVLLTKWLDLNQDVLKRYWDGEFDFGDMIDAIRQVKTGTD